MQRISKVSLLSILSLLLVLSSCRKEKYIGTLVDYPGEKEGLIQAYTENGMLYEEGQFKQGVLDGYRKIYYPDGKLQIVETYKNGKFEGPFVKYHKNGKKKVEGKYVNSTMEGIWKTYYDTEALKDEVMMHDNLENGPFKEFYENGKLKAIGAYKNGEFEHGPLQLFDESGTLIKKMDCENGICRTTWKKQVE